MFARLLPFVAFIIVLSSCSAAYKSTRTPDDLYYADATVIPVKDERNDRTRDRYEKPSVAQDDNYLRMKVRNRERWDCIDDFDYWYDPRYDFSVWSPNRYELWTRRNDCACRNNVWIRPNAWYGGWNAYNPYVSVITYKNPRQGSTSASTVRAFNNTSIVNNNGSVVTNPKTGVRTWQPAVSRSESVGTDRPSRTWSPSVQPSSNAGGRSGGFGSSGSSSGGARPGRN